MIKNPFEITKAINFTAQELNDFWVDIHEGGNKSGFREIVKPMSPVPMILLGGKGSGKTHIIKYYSYEVQKIRHGKNLFDGIMQEGFIGIYFLLGGLNEGRFKSNGIQQNVWDVIFMYYMEINIAIRTLEVLKNFLDEAHTILENESKFCESISALFTNKTVDAKSINDLIAIFDKIRREIDYKLNNCVFLREIEVDIQITRGTLVFGIPEILSTLDQRFKDKKILYILDEIENIDENGQKYLQSIIREAKSNTSIKLSGRLYGLKTKKTFSDNENNMEGSEFELLELDRELRNNHKAFEDFSLRLCLNRVKNRYPEIDTIEKLENFFEFWEESSDAESDTDDGKPESDRLGRIWSDLLSSKRIHMENLNTALGKIPITMEIKSQIINNLTCKEYPFVEKFNTFLFYKEWAHLNGNHGAKLLSASEKVKHNAEIYLDDVRFRKSLHHISHFKADVLAQMCQENPSVRIKLKREYYSGLKTFIRISGGMPRTLLLLLKSAFAAASNDGDPFENNNKISFEAQRKAVLKTSHWFFDDAINCGEKAELQHGIDNLATFFKEMRYSDKPTECSCISFSFNSSEVTEQALKVIELARTHSLLFAVWDGRKSKNSSDVQLMYQLNPILSPKWNLAITRRGTIPLSGVFVNSIFDPQFYDKYEKLKKERLHTMNAPFKIQTTLLTQEELGLSL